MGGDCTRQAAAMLSSSTLLAVLTVLCELQLSRVTNFCACAQSLLPAALHPTLPSPSLHLSFPVRPSYPTIDYE